jgi:hypothetical protein
MMHHPVMKMICMITWPITALVSINVLTAMYNYDAFDWLVNMMPGAAMLLVWIVGLSGIVSMVAFVKAMFMCCPGCGSCPCTCNNHLHNNIERM